MLTVNISAFILELGADLNNPQFQHTGEGDKKITYHHDWGIISPWKATHLSGMYLPLGLETTLKA
jgi:hypothetical protein